MLEPSQGEAIHQTGSVSEAVRLEIFYVVQKCIIEDKILPKLQRKLKIRERRFIDQSKLFSQANSKQNGGWKKIQKWEIV